VSSCEVEAALESLIETGLGRAETGWPIITAKRRPHHVRSGWKAVIRPRLNYAGAPKYSRLKLGRTDKPKPDQAEMQAALRRARQGQFMLLEPPTPDRATLAARAL
jgi:hypothetical protein